MNNFNDYAVTLSVPASPLACQPSNNNAIKNQGMTLFLQINMDLWLNVLKSVTGANISD